MKARIMATVVLLAAVVQAVPGASETATTVQVVVGPAASELERLAARELSGQFERLFGATVSTNSSLSEEAAQAVVIGRPDSNPTVKEALGNRWPRVSEQGIVIRSFQRGEQQGVGGRWRKCCRDALGGL